MLICGFPILPMHAGVKLSSENNKGEKGLMSDWVRIGSLMERIKDNKIEKKVCFFTLKYSTAYLKR